MLDAVLSHFPDAKRNGTGWRAKCPAHDGDSPNSLSIAPGENGGTVLHCFKGCSAESIVSAVGLTMPDLMPANSNGVHRNGHAMTTPAAPKPKGKAYPTLEAAISAAERSTGGTLAGQWEYPDAAGELVGVVARFNLPDGSKTFRPFHPEGAEWRFGDPPGKWPVYGKAAPPRTYLVEGERCRELMDRLGLPCITSAHGSNGATHTDWSGVSNIEVVALPDHDDAGTKYVATVAAILRGQGCRVRVVCLADVWRDLPEGGDIVDMLADGGPWECRDDADVVAALNELADAAPEVRADDPPATETKSGADDENETAMPERWIPRRLAEFQNEEPPTFILPGIVAAGHTTSVSAKPKVGKTEWVQGLIRPMRDGGTFMGLPVESGRVLIVSEESPGLWIKRDAERPIGNHVWFVCRPFTSRPSPADWETYCRQVARIAARKGIALVVIDTFSKVSPVENENDSAQVSAAMMALTPIVETGAGLLLIHHERKSGGDEGDAIRGSGAFAASVDVLAELRRFAPKDRSDRRRTLTVTGRFSECPAEEMVIELGTDGDYSAIGNRKQARNRDRWALLDPILPDAAPGLTVDELLARWPEDDKPGSRTLMMTLRAGQDSGRVLASGSGTKGDAFRFYRRLPEIRANAHPLALQSARKESEGVDSQRDIPFAQSKPPSMRECANPAARQNGRVGAETAVRESGEVVEGVL